MEKIVKIQKISKENAIFQQILSIKDNRTKRHSLKKIFVEGVQNIKEAIDNDWQITDLIFTDFASLSSWAKNIIKNNTANNYEMSLDLMKKLSDKSDTSEILAIFSMKEQTNIAYDTSAPIILLLDRPSKKGNLGNIIRSADAMHVDQILFTGHSVDIYDHEVISASMGSFFKVQFRHIDTNEEFDDYVSDLRSKYKNMLIVASSLQSDRSIIEEDFTSPVLLMMGNERSGLGRHFYEKADSILKIKMRENIDSLNLACATSIFLYEINRQRKLV